VSEVLAPTTEVVTVNVPVDWPAPMLIDAGTDAEAPLEPKVTVRELPVATGPFKVTVPVEETPPFTVVGLRLKPKTTGAVTVKIAVSGVPSCVAVIVALALAATAKVATGKVAVVLPEVTFTELGTDAAALLLELRRTVMPAAGAGSLRVTVPVGLVPPITDVGLTDTLLTYWVRIDKTAVLFALFNPAVIVEVVVVAILRVVTVNVPVVRPA
jgi:hypothetical protein